MNIRHVVRSPPPLWLQSSCGLNRVAAPEQEFPATARRQKPNPTWNNKIRSWSPLEDCLKTHRELKQAVTSFVLTFDTQFISWLLLRAAYPPASASNWIFPKWSTLAMIPNRFCIVHKEKQFENHQQKSRYIPTFALKHIAQSHLDIALAELYDRQSFPKCPPITFVIDGADFGTTALEEK